MNEIEAAVVSRALQLAGEFEKRGEDLRELAGDLSNGDPYATST